MPITELTPCCPDCEGENIVKVCEEVSRVKHGVALYANSGGIVSDFEQGEQDRELLESGNDDAEFQCEDCGYSTADPDDFAPEEEDDE